MAFIPVPTAAKVVIGYALGTMTWSNTLWFSKEQFDTNDMATLAQLIGQNVAIEMRGQMSADCSCTGVTVYDMRSETAPIYFSDNAAGVGSQTGDAAPINVALVVTLRTDTRGRSGRGRLYLTGFPDGYWNDNTFETVALESTLDIYEDIFLAIAASGWTWVVVSQYTNKAPRSSGVCYPITSAVVRSGIAATQRRRVDRP